MRVIGDTVMSADVRAAAHLRRGLAYVQKAGQSKQKEDISRALLDLSESLRLVPDNPAQNDIHQLRANLYFHNGDYDRALADFAVLIRLDATSAKAYAYRGYVYAAKGEHDLAIADYTEAIRLDPKIAGSYTQRAWSYLQVGKAVEGVLDADRALALDPNDAAAYGTRGLIFRSLGKTAETIADLRKSLALDPSNEAIKEELRKIDQAREAETKQVAASEKREKELLEAVRLALEAAKTAEQQRQEALKNAEEARQSAQEAKRRLADREAQQAPRTTGPAAPDPRARPPLAIPAGPAQSAAAIAPTPPPAAPAGPGKPDEPAVGTLSSSRPASPLSSAEELALKPRDAFRECENCAEMIVVPAGEFMMGSNDGEADEKPLRKVSIGRPFAVSRFEVTFAEWDACVSDGGCKHKPQDKGWGRGKRPVVNVSWDDVTNEYVPWLNRKTGKQYRLLSEAEWEYVARAGSGTKYTWGDDIGRGRANCDGCGSEWDNKQTAPVGSFQPNAFGLHDVHGNVAEWVADCKASYANLPLAGETAPETPECTRVSRGGSWYNRTNKVRAAFRGKASPAERIDWFGFRLARTLAP
jgi:formylglycine-generating enzyme required for sulfatase activity